MYFYLYDSWVQDRKYQAEIIKIEARLNALGINGRTEKITILKNIHEAIRDGLKRGATTVVLVGNDKTITTVLPDILNGHVTVGFIPLGEPQTIAKFFGIPTGVAACDVLSRRVVVNVDVGQANEQYFLLNAAVPAGANIQCDGEYTVSSVNPAEPMVITNLETSSRTSNPADGRLELKIGSAPKQRWGSFGKSAESVSIFPIRKAKVTAAIGQSQLLLDGQVTVTTPLIVTLAKKKLAVIVGRDRQF